MDKASRSREVWQRLTEQASLNLFLFFLCLYFALFILYLYGSSFCFALLCFALLCFALLCFALLCCASLCFALFGFRFVWFFALFSFRFALLCSAALCFVALCCDFLVFSFVCSFVFVLLSFFVRLLVRLLFLVCRVSSCVFQCLLVSCLHSIRLTHGYCVVPPPRAGCSLSLARFVCVFRSIAAPTFFLFAGHVHLLASFGVCSSECLARLGMCLSSAVRSIVTEPC